MMNNSQARLVINDKVFSFTGISQDRIQYKNQKDFIIPDDGVWCRVTTNYSDTFEAGLYKGQLERDYGIINIQCFDRKGNGEVDVTELADKWREHWRGFVSTYLEVDRTHAPTDANSEIDDDFVISLVRIEFHVN